MLIKIVHYVNVTHITNILITTIYVDIKMGNVNIEVVKKLVC